MYDVHFTPEAAADLTRLDVPNVQRVFSQVRWWAENFDDVRPEPLADQWKGVFKFRVMDDFLRGESDLRVQYTVDKVSQRIVVHFFRHRREVYKIPYD